MDTQGSDTSAQGYTYDPGKVKEDGLHRMRFELGDTMVERGAKTCALADAEIVAALETHKSHWKRAKLMLLESICMRFSYEVDTKVGPLSYSLGDRSKRWWEMRNTLKRELAASSAPVLPPAVTSGQAYFYTGMMDNPPAEPPSAKSAVAGPAGKGGGAR